MRVNVCNQYKSLQDARNLSFYTDHVCNKDELKSLLYESQHLLFHKRAYSHLFLDMQ